jgi:hypothetical protein
MGIQHRSGHGVFAGERQSRIRVNTEQTVGEEQPEARDGEPGEDPDTARLSYG